ncbi:hydrolase or acyltransferase [Nitzschia inconspicua]|uniref:Hydrolase or acyltransferase n=1 Tax=Nitzschia inconspicua TaxID=303405 RepID=A0A9K3LJ44_9STRA|nr:hydrolase or acyltransferase [Nitzschia inconspicua]
MRRMSPKTQAFAAVAFLFIALSSSKSPLHPLGVTALSSRVPDRYAEVSGNMKDERLILPTSGIEAQVISCSPTNVKADKPPLIFLHGSFHGAWCWQEHYIPYFVDQGFPCIALSWRGTGGTSAGEGVKKIKILEHCQDLQGLLDLLPTILGRDDRPKPILVSHSMAGIYVMKFLEECWKEGKKPRDLFAGIALLCSTPPSGNGKATMRVLKRSLRDAYKITVGFVLKKVNTDATICRLCFFGGNPKVLEDGTIDDLGVSDDDIARYQSYFERDSQAVLDVVDLSKNLPSKLVDSGGQSPFVKDLPPSIVIGAADDFVVDKIGVEESCRYFGLDQPVFVDSPHDVMLTQKWQNGANALLTWIEKDVLDQ